MIGQHDPGRVLAWIQERSTCQIPDQESSTELHTKGISCISTVTTVNIKGSASIHANVKTYKISTVSSLNLSYPHIIVIILYLEALGHGQ